MHDSGADTSVRVWDLFVRVFHWTLVALFVTAWLSGDESESLHELAGYGICALIAARIVWGFVGSRHARFADFVYGPAAVVAYLRSLLGAAPRHYLGHNPAAGWMVLVLLAVLAATCWSGIELLAEEGRGPLAAATHAVVVAARANDDDDDHGRGRGRGHGGEDDADEFWEDFHEVLADLALVLVLVHVAGVVVSSLLHHENLVRAMITGRKPAPRSPR